MRGSIVKRGKSYSIVLDLPPKIDPDTGKKKRNQKWITVKGNKKDAERKLAELVNAANRGEFVESSSRTFGQWLDEWLDTVVASGKRRPRTVESYRSVVRNHVKPALGGIRLQELRPLDLQAYYNGLDLSPTTKAQHQAIIHSALDAAWKLGYVARNVAKLVPDKPKRADSPEDITQNCWTADEARAFLSSAKDRGVQAEAFYTVALQTGMRKGELCGLKWSDVDTQANTITVSRTLLKAKADPVYGPPKNGQARTIPVAPETMKLLRRHKLNQDEVKMRFRQNYHDHGLVFAKEWEDVSGHGDTLGNPIQMNNIGQREFAKLIQTANVKRITFHGMRHTFATLALMNGTQPHVVQKMLGHKRIEITLGIYGHVLPDMKQEAAQKMAALLKS